MVVEVSRGYRFLCHLEEFDFGCVVVVGMIGSCVVVVSVLVVVEVAGHLVVTDPMNYRVALVIVWVPPVWSLLVVALMLKLLVAELVPLVHRRPRMMRKLRTKKKMDGDSVALVLAQHLAPRD